MNPKDVVIASVAGFVGLVLGIGLVAVPYMPEVLQDKSALGSLLGSFLAAVIGLTGAIWATLHTSAKADASRRHELASLASSLVMEVWLISVGTMIYRIAIQKAVGGQIRHGLARIAAESLSTRKMLDRVQHDLGRLGPEFALALPAFYDQAEGLGRSVASFLQFAEGDYPVDAESAKALELLVLQMDQVSSAGAEILFRLTQFASPSPWPPERWKAAMIEGANGADAVSSGLAAQFPTLWPKHQA